jgi:outer membrane protein OmpA-like peptidoglycan-associated protein
MVSKKQKLLFFGIICLISSAAYAQAPTAGNFRDSSVIPSKRLAQHNEFLNNAYAFPAKPRNQIEVGAKFGSMMVSGDLPAVFPTFGWGVHVRKAFGYIFSLRLEYINGVANGLNWNRAFNYGKNGSTLTKTGILGAGTGNLYAANTVDNQGNRIPAAQIFYYNYKAKIQDLSLEGIVTFNNLRFHKSKTGFNFYGLVGIGATVYDTKINALNGSTPYNFSSITVFDDYSKRKDTRKALKSLLDDSYETDAENQGPRRPTALGGTLRPSGTLGFGFAVRLSKRVNIALEDRQTFIKDDLLDGQRWQEHAFGDAVLTRDFDSYNFASLGLNVNLGGKATEPLYWSNPLDYAYNELNAPRHMKFPKPVLDDGDGDGVTDQFDNEPNTPQGCPVDTHGVSKDTDGDGVPDCKDKEMITPTQCQPVDADGIGKCPTTCCDSIMQLMKDGKLGTGGGCGIGTLPNVSFAGRAVTLSKDAKAVLAGVAEKMRNSPNCKVAVIGYGESSKSAQQLSWDRVNAVIKYMVEKEGLNQERFIFKYGEGAGDGNTVDLQDGTGQEGPNKVDPPHPSLRKKK